MLSSSPHYTKDNSPPRTISRSRTTGIYTVDQSTQYRREDDIMRLLAAVVFLMAVAISPAAAAPAASLGKMVVITPPSKWQSWSMDPARQTKEAFTAQFPHYLEGVYHNAMVPLKEQLREGPEGMAIKMLQPTLHIHSGCHPYTAVSATGQVNKGLKNSGTMNGHCDPGKDHHEGQTYVRGAWHKGRYAIMYSWYMPKDQNVNGPVNGGHRHEWESVVIWVKGCKCTPIESHVPC